MPPKDYSLPLFGETDNGDKVEPNNLTPKNSPVGHTPNQNKQPAEDSNSEPIEIEFEYDGIDREKIVDFINSLSLPTYQIRSFQMNDYLKSLFSLCRLRFKCKRASYRQDS